MPNHKKRKKTDDQPEASSISPPPIIPLKGKDDDSRTPANCIHGNGIASKKANNNNDSLQKAKQNVDVTSGSDDAPGNDQAFVPLTLDEIRSNIKNLCTKVPRVPPNGIDGEDMSAVRDWAQRMQAVIEEFNLLLCCVANATYKWGSDRSGAADQNLSMLSNELGNAQDQISSSVTPRLTNVLAPVVDLVEAKATKTINKETGEEVKVKEYGRELVDPSFLKLCSTILSRNAKMLRQVVLTNFNKIDRVIDDYQKAAKKDSHHDRTFAY